MPIYEYRCADCGHTLDALQKLADEPLKDCPECSHPALKRLMSAPAFRLKGGGWYETDFKSEKEKKRNLADGGDGKVSDGKTAEGKSGEGKSGEGKGKDDKSKGDSGKTGSKDAAKTEAGKSVKTSSDTKSAA
jgi:putative FmdB family regulatory protein